MKIITNTYVTILLLTISCNASAGVLMKQWTDATHRYCEYSNGEVDKVGFGTVCPTTN